MKNYTKLVKHRIAQFLNEATAVVVQSYSRYLGSDLSENLDDPSKEPADFKKFHDAGKSAASHLESLLKLAQATDDPQEAEKQAEQEQHQAAQEALKNAHKELDEG